MKFSLIVEARTGSRRLPNKILLKIKKKNFLEYLLIRLSKIKKIDNFIVATSTNKKDKEDTVDDSGAREFFTTISFVRGIVTDARGNFFSRGVGIFSDDPKLDKDTRTQPPSDDVNKTSVCGTSDSLDPDPDRLSGD